MNERIRELAVHAGDNWDHTLESDKEFLEKFAALVAAEEREACAKVVEEAPCECCWPEGSMLITEELAAAIRARGNE